MLLTDYQTERLLTHVSTMPFRTNILSGLYSMNAYFMLQALAITSNDLRSSKGARIGDIFSAQFEAGIRGAGFKLAGLKDYKPILCDAFEGARDQREIRAKLISYIDERIIPNIAQLIEP